VGDKVFVLMGGDLPFVLRPIGGNFYAFGAECYVHGVMDGEMLTIARAKKEGLEDERLNNHTWKDKLGDGPWLFKSQELILV